MSWVVIVSEHRNSALTGSAAVNYQSPAHESRDEALLLVELLNGAAPVGEGPWPDALAGGQRTVGLRHHIQRNPAPEFASPLNVSPSGSRLSVVRGPLRQT
jgi:hypothetical protein